MEAFYCHSQNLHILISIIWVQFKILFALLLLLLLNLCSVSMVCDLLICKSNKTFEMWKLPLKMDF